MGTETAFEWSEQRSAIDSRRATLINHMLLAAIVGGLVALLTLYFGMPETMGPLDRLVEMAPFIVGWLAVLITWAWRGLPYRARALLFLLIVYVVGIVVFARGGLPGSGRVWLLLLPGLAFVLLGPGFGVTAGALSILTYVVFAIALVQRWIVPEVAEDLSSPAPLIAEGGSFLLVTAVLTIILWSFHRGWIVALKAASEANRQLQAQAEELEATTVRLARQSSQFQTATDIARAGYAILDLERLLVEVVNRIQEGFSAMGVYYAGLFLLDEEEHSATLRAATGEVGQLVLETDYKLELDDRSTVGRSVIHRQPRVVLDVEAARGAGAGAGATLPVPMPYTRSEIALPLRSRGRVLGALNLHSTQKEAFSQDDIAILQTMADQVAVAVDNARLFSQTAGLLEEVQAVQRRYLAEAWRTFLVARPVTGVEYTQPGAELPEHGALLRQARQEAVAEGRTVVKSVALPLDDEGREMEHEAALVVPLRLHGQVIGTLALHTHGLSEGAGDTAGERPWTDEDVAMVETVAEQMALTVDNLRLMDQTQRRAAREQLVSEIADRMQRAVDVEDLMRITAEGLNEALGGSRAFIQMQVPVEAADEG